MSQGAELRHKSLSCYYPNRRLRVLLAAIRRVAGPNARVLDIGCGPGVLGEWLADLGIEYLGVDIDDDYCAYARARGLDVRQLDVRTQPDLGLFDAVVLSEVLEHVADPFDMLAAVRGYVTPGGVLLLTVPSLSLFRYLKHRMGRPGAKISDTEHRVEFAPGPITPPDEFWMSYRELLDRVRQCGYEVVWRKGVGALDFPKGLRIADRVFQWMGPWLLDALDFACGCAAGLVGCRYLCLGLRPGTDPAQR